MKRQFSVCQIPLSKYPTIFNKSLSASIQLYSTVSQLFEPQVQKIAIFTYRSPHFCFCWRRPCAYHAVCCMDGREFNACQTTRSMYLSIFNSFRVIRWLSPKIAIFTYRSRHFCFPWRRFCDYHAMCCMDGKSILCLPNSSQHISIYLEYFPSYTMLKSMRKFKNRYFLPRFGFPLGRPWCNHAKCCMDGKRIRCLQIVSLHVPI